LVNFYQTTRLYKTAIFDYYLHSKGHLNMNPKSVNKRARYDVVYWPGCLHKI
jgi:hypothetical protein